MANDTLQTHQMQLKSLQSCHQFKIIAVNSLIHVALYFWVSPDLQMCMVQE